MFKLFQHELFSRWVSILGWGIGLSLFGSIYIGSYPTFEEQMGAFAQIDFYRILGFDMASFEGYIASVVVQIVPLILGVYVIMLSTGTLAGEEENGTLELVAAMPLKRWQIVTMKAAALSLVLFLIMLVFSFGASITMSLVKTVSDLDAEPYQLFLALLGAYPMMLAYFAIGLFLGSFMPSRMSAVGVLAVIYISGFLINSLAGFLEGLEVLEYFSLNSYLNTTASVFTDWHEPLKLLVLLIVALVFFLLTLWSFEGRNLTVGQWIWERKQVASS